MNLEEIRRVVQEQERAREIILAEEQLVEREVGAESLRSYIGFPNVLALLGVRRCGKSVLSWLLLRGKPYGYINFDDEALFGVKASDLNLVLKAFYKLYGNLDYFVFDEIQNVKGWELFVSRLRMTKKIVVTGSNSQLLSGELATHLTGRHIDFVLFPFSFNEFCVYKKIDLSGVKASEFSTETSALMENALSEYVTFGGLPEAYKFGKPILKAIFGDIVAKDIIRRYAIRTGVMESLAKYLVSNISNEFTFSKLKNIFSIKSLQTIRNYVNYLENAYLFFVIERFSFKLKEQFIAPKKIYCVDTGMANAVSFSASRNIGKLFENAVCVELLRRKSYFANDNEVYYWKNPQHEEVDFVVKRGKSVSQLIQVCYDLGEVGVKNREVRSLLKASRELRCKNLLVITSDEEGEEAVEGKRIRYVPLWKWLLGIRA